MSGGGRDGGGDGRRRVRRKRQRSRSRERSRERRPDRGPKGRSGESPIRETSVRPSPEGRERRAAAVAGERDPEGFEPRILARADHPISRKNVTQATLKVLYRLKKGGYKSFLCGGAVRDLMLGREPKDFDVATDATPREVKKLFRNGRIIGRRFRLVHIMFHDEIVEVATFRRTPDPQEQRTGPNDNLITSDNTWGSPREDAFRRDFTVNGLFYNVADFSVVDYVGGIDDLENGLVRVIGDPDLRFQEDPVRMMRACEFAGRLGFQIEESTQEGIRRNAEDIVKGAPPRLTEELVQLLRCGHAADAIGWMLELGLVDHILPEARAMVRAGKKGVGRFAAVLDVLDEMAEQELELPDQVLIGALLLPQVLLRRFDYETKKERWMPAKIFRRVVQEAISHFQERYALAKIKKSMLSHALDGFHRMCDPNWTPAQRSRFASKSYFDDALLLFEILVRATGEGHEALEHWQTAQSQRSRRPEPHVDRKRRNRGGGGRGRGGGRRGRGNKGRRGGQRN